MVTKQQLAALFSALGNERRLKIIEKIEEGIANPGEIGKKLDVTRSTIEKHIRVLATRGALKKNLGLNPEGQLRVYYKVQKKARSY